MGDQLSTMRGERQVGNCQLKQLINKAQDENHDPEPLAVKSKNIPKSYEYAQCSSGWPINHSPTEALQPWQVVFEQVALLLLCCA